MLSKDVVLAVLYNKGNKFLKNCSKIFPNLHSEGEIVKKITIPQKIPTVLLSSHETPPFHILIY